MRTIVIYKWT